MLWAKSCEVPASHAGNEQTQAQRREGRIIGVPEFSMGIGAPQDKWVAVTFWEAGQPCPAHGP